MGDAAARPHLLEAGAVVKVAREWQPGHLPPSFSCCYRVLDISIT